MSSLNWPICIVNEGSGTPLRAWPVRQRSARQENVRRKVLVVDDQHLVADTVRDVLENAGFEAHAAYDAWQALEMMSSLQPDVLLSDVLMPRMNGVELAIVTTSMHPATRIVLFSGQAGVSEILEEAQQRGYTFELLAKPIHPEDLIRRLREH